MSEYHSKIVYELTICRSDVERIYRYSLKGSRSVLEEQLEMAKVKEHAVQVRNTTSFLTCSSPGFQKVLLTGGFGQSPFLQSYLRRWLADQTNLAGQKISLIMPEAG